MDEADSNQVADTQEDTQDGGDATDVPTADENQPPSQLVVCLAGSADPSCQFFGGDGLQQAFDAAPVGANDSKTTILIKAGNYLRTTFTEYQTPGTPDPHKRKAFAVNNGKFLVLQAEPNTRLDGAQSAPMSGLIVAAGTLEIHGLECSGFVADDASCNNTDTVTPCSAGNGVGALGISQLALVGCKLQNNKAVGVYISGSSQATIQDSVVSGNNWGLSARGNAIFTIQGNQVTDGLGDAIYFYDSTKGTISRNVIRANKGTGIYAGLNADLTISGNQLTDGQAAGITLRESSKGSIFNNLIARNKAEGVYVGEQVVASLVNNTIHANAGAGISVYSCNADNPATTIANNLLTSNLKAADNTMGYGIGGACLHDAGKLDNDVIQYNLQWNNVAQNTQCSGYEYCGGTGSLTVDPQYVDANASDFHLKAGSLARNAGDPAKTNPDNSRTDMGAFGGPNACLLDATLPGCS